MWLPAEPSLYNPAVLESIVTGDNMTIYATRLFLLCFALLFPVAGNIAIAQEPPANVAGNWTIHSKGPDGGDRTQHMQITQAGNVITGHYQGPGQEGELEGTVDGSFALGSQP
jgi:hypothetical protein